MKFIKGYNKFVESAAEPATKPTVKPSTPGTRPGTSPNTKPSKPTPIRRERPSVDPDPKALKKATAEEVSEKFIDLMINDNEDVKKYAKTV